MRARRPEYYCTAIPQFTMETVEAVFYIVLLTSTCCGGDPCDSPQYFGIGSTGVVQCSFNEQFFAVVWYTSNGYKEKESLIRVINGEKSGDGFTSGDFDILLNGSLVIRNVSFHHDQSFYVLKFESASDDNPVLQDVRVIVTVKPSGICPTISQCGAGCRTCFTRLDPAAEVSCFVRGAKPPVSLSWVVRTAKGDMNITSQSSVETNGPLSTSNATTSNVFSSSPLLNFLVCKAKSTPSLLYYGEIAVLLENTDRKLSSGEPLTKYVKKGSAMELSCSGDNTSLIVWRRWRQNDDGEVLVAAVLFEGGFTIKYSEEFDLSNGGIITFPKVNTQQEGLYGCVFQNEEKIGGASFTDVIIYVPRYPTINGCLTDSCVVKAEKDGILSCSVEGVRPLVQLELQTLHAKDSSIITFTDNEVTINSNLDTFDVLLTTKYHLEQAEFSSKYMIKIVCKIVEPNVEVFNVHTSFNLLVTFDQKMDALQVKIVWIIGGVILIAIVIVIITIALLYVLKGKLKEKPRRVERTQEELDLFLQSSTDENFEEKRKRFIKQLREKYELMYNAFKPIPYSQGRQYCVNSVFVDKGIAFLASLEGDKGRGTWKDLPSYHHLLSEPHVNKLRCILEGDPGYGKSTFMMQLSYDWCNQIEESPLSTVDLFVLLQLRKMKRGMSIYRAIKQFLLPHNTNLSDEDIEELIAKVSSAVIVLDGYDEYYDRHDSQSDVNKIVSKEMFQEFVAIVTTRSSLLPTNYAIGTKRFRLTGFDDAAREKYLRDVVVEGNVATAAIIKQRLQSNPVLLDLCQVPLFFVMFAHLMNDNSESVMFNSVTSFCRHVISCFNSHMGNKMGLESISHVDAVQRRSRKLEKVAFESLSANCDYLIWEEEYLRKQIGKAAYELHVRIGILVVENKIQINVAPGDKVTNYIQKTKSVRFYHKVFCEWYAAHFVSRKIEKMSLVDVGNFLRKLDPSDVHYVYRFVCGLNSSAGEKVIEYLKTMEGGEQFTLLCTLEQEGKTNELLDTVRYLCSTTVHIDRTSEKLLQRYTTQLLEIASSNLIPVPAVLLVNCFKKVDSLRWKIELESKISIPALHSLQVLVIHENWREIEKNEIEDILLYSARCTQLKVLRFQYCILPRCIQSKTLSSLQSRNFEVSWYFGWTRHRFNVDTGLWEDALDGKILTAPEYAHVMGKISHHKQQATLDE